MQLRFVKTSAGQAEIQSRTRSLTRPVRNLLLVINDTQPVSYWLDSVKGISEADFDLLVAEGLIEVTRSSSSSSGRSSSTPSREASATSATSAAAAPAAAPTPAPVPQPAAANDGEGDWAMVRQAINQADYSHLYDALTGQGKSLLGLMRGYRFVLEVEKCSGIAELRALALRFVEQLRDDQGMNAVRRFSDALSKPR